MDITASVSGSTPSPCPQQNGTLTVTAHGGNSVLICEWYSDSGYTNLIQTGFTLSAPAGLYYYKVKDSTPFGAPDFLGNGSISQTQMSNTYVSVVHAATTTGGTDGSVDIGFASAATLAYPIFYELDANGSFIQVDQDGIVNVPGLSVGSHTILTTDAYGCQNTLTFIVDDPAVSTLIPLNPNLKFCDISNSVLKIIDETGNYSTTNAGGFGNPNPDVSSVTSALLTIVLSNGTTYADIDVLGTTFPNTDGGYILLDKTRLPNGLSDGLAQITYTLSGTTLGVPWSITKKFLVYITATVRCCVKKLNASITSWESCCEDSSAKNFLKAFNMLTNIEWLAKECCFFSKADEVLAQLQSFCKSHNCTTC